ncbi:SDR family NAD(P)-dependent oxidoreductase [Cryptosporangium arvum]|uniref:SDR family NAD(P)-dependent oxidoreductase n=1 Tax=Cryptosporangium arvum TaxID=80871 RepID=UPI0004B41C28|nr:SDR family NAD(P)-dependent oxidoreductase [Cryptosporangium arvum]
MTTTFITGANKSLGFESARRLIEAGHTVIVGARDPERGRAAAAELNARFVQIDVTDDASVAAAAADVAAHEGHVDVLINNAGVPGVNPPPAEITGDDARAVFETNVVGVVRVTHAFLPLLSRSGAPVIVNVGSGLGSFGVTHDPERFESTFAMPLYDASKAALSMLTTQYAKALPQMRINVVDPGYTATDFNGHSGPQTISEGTDAIVALATIGSDGPTGTFQDRHGAVPW